MIDDRTRKALEARAAQLAGCTEGSIEEAELAFLARSLRLRCANCEFGEPSEYDERAADGLRHCTRWLDGYGHSVDEVQSDGAWVENDEGWGNVIGPDFGCVLFRDKDGGRGSELD